MTTISHKLSYRNVAIDTLRSFAIIGVVLMHSVEMVYLWSNNLSPIQNMSNLSLWTKLWVFLLFICGRIGVPLFLMITGYLLLDREYSNKTFSNFLRYNWLPLIRITMIWSILYYFFLIFVKKQSISIERMINQLFFIGDTDFQHFWYMPIIIGLYAFIPIIAVGIKLLYSKAVFGIISVFIVLNFGLPTLQSIFPNTILSSSIQSNFMGSYYGIYVLVGFLLKQKILRKIATGWLSLLLICLTVLLVVMQLFIYVHQNVFYMLWYDNFLVLCCAVIIFELCLRLQLKRNRLIEIISYYSFSVYLTHYIVIQYVGQYIQLLPLYHVFKFLILFVITFVGSIFFSCLIKQLPFGKWLLNLK